jgi:hypothetical protein
LTVPSPGRYATWQRHHLRGRRNRLQLSALQALVLSERAGAGHVRRDALVEALRGRGQPARHEEVLRHTNPLFKRLYADLYLELVNRQPELLGWMYDALDKPWQFQKRRLALDRLNTGPLKTLLRRNPPRLALCTTFAGGDPAASAAKGRITDILGIVVTDLTPTRSGSTLMSTGTSSPVRRRAHTSLDSASRLKPFT